MYVSINFHIHWCCPNVTFFILFFYGWHRDIAQYKSELNTTVIEQLSIFVVGVGIYIKTK